MHRTRKTRAQPAPFMLLDRKKNGSYKPCVMIRCARVALVLVVIFSVAYVLISPDPTDDVEAVLRAHHPLKAQRLVAVSLSQFQLPIIAIFRFFTSPICTRRLAAVELLDFICVSRC